MGWQHLLKRALGRLGLDLRRLKNNPAHTLLGLRDRPIGTILDVGANTGQFARQMLGVFPAATIVSFEPLPTAFAELQRQAAQHTPRWQAVNVALGDSTGHAEMFFHVDHSASSSLLPGTEALAPLVSHVDRVRVPLTTLDRWMADSRPAIAGEMLLKLDVQGFEDRVVRGAQETLPRCSAIIVEVNNERFYDGQTGFADIFDLLREHFDFVGVLEQVFAENGRVRWFDAVFMRREGNRVLAS